MLTNLKPVQLFLTAQIICIFIVAVVAALFWGVQGFAAVVLGGAVAMMNAVGTAFAWPRILEKKDVALAVGIIVSKFALSIGVFYWLTRPPSAYLSGKSWLETNWLETIWFGDQSFSLGTASGTLIGFALGLSSVVPAALVVSFVDLSGKSPGKKIEEPEQRMNE